MGDRANIKIEAEDEEPIFLYTHWNGYCLPETLQGALARKERWDDSQYLTRIIFSEMIKADILDEGGYGISTIVHDGDDRIITVNCADQTVAIRDLIWTFKEFININIENIRF